MKDQWRKYGRRFDAMSMRERLMVYVAVVSLVLFAGFQFGMAKALSGSTRLSAQIQQNQGETAIAQQQSQILARSLADDPNVALRKQIAAITQQVEEKDATVRSVQKGLVPPTKMAAVLENMLNRSRGVKLVSLKTLPVKTLVERPVEEGAAEAAEVVDEHQVYKHGVEITLQGGYLELADYLARLEQLPWQMFWARTDMDASDYPRVRVTLTLYTLSLDKAWLVV
jgi:MSHA biogenesis protein MshJ